ncbi:MAG: tRNA lysidine(34) synthetase TilS [Kiritimatiellae bacterium]|nr:tRNA lysidine(34) synthetase TilS [Kiritimatiellia bacterium]
MLKLVRAAIETHRLITPGEHVLVAVSGGPDSVALLAVLKRLGARYSLRLTAAHLNHQLRAGAAAHDAACVAALADQLGVAYVEGRARVRQRARNRGLSLEMAAREARYDFLVRAARRAGADTVATGHTADDQAETVLLKLLRGAGRRGLAGIPVQTCWKGMRVVRPLLDVSRRQVLAFLCREKLAWCEDESNRSPAFLRNRVRHELLPLLESRINPAARDVLRRTARVLGEEDRWLDTLAQAGLAACTLDGSRAALDGGRLLQQPLAARRRIIRLWLARNGVGCDALDFDMVERIESLLRSSHGTATTPLPDCRAVRREYGTLRLADRVRSAARPAAFRARLAVPGETRLPAQRLRVRTRLTRGWSRPRPAPLGALPAAVRLRAARARKAPLLVRSWRPGDRIHPLGLDGSKKLQDLFVDAKLPRAQRNRVPVLECAGEIVWVPGYRIARDWALRRPEEESIEVIIERT